MRLLSYRWAGAAAAALGLFAATAAGQPPRSAPTDPIESERIRQKIADDKVKSEVLEAVKFADGLARSSPARAIQTLQKAQLDLVDLRVGISGATRKQLTSLLDGRIAAYGGKPSGRPAPGIQLDPRRQEVKADQKEVVAKYFAELKDVRDGIKKVEQYQAGGKNPAADAEIARLTKKYPNNPSVLALGQKDSIQNRIKDAQAYYAESASRWVELQKQINTSSLPAIRDLEFPKDWKEKSERRLKAFRVQLTAKEKKIIEALDSPMSINWNERPLEEALQDLSNQFDQPLLLDKKSLEDLGLDLKKGVSLQGKGITGRTALRAILATQGLTFVVKDETIQVVTVERSKTLLTTRVYYLGDLTQGVGPFGDINWGPFLNAQQTQANVVALVDAIRKIDPLSWDGRNTGGPGTITYHAPTQSIIVRNSAEVHFSLGNAFYGKK
jgi:hypothetical protein